MPLPPRVDWSQIKGKWVADDRRVAILDNRAIHLVLSLMPRFQWAATFDHDEEAQTDWDEIQRIITNAEFELGVAMPLSEIIQYIDEVESLLTALVAHSQCCGQPADPTFGDYYTDPVIDGAGNVPQNIVDSGYASSTSDWAGFDDYKCMIAHLMIESLEMTLRQFLPTFDSSGAIIGGIGSVAALLGTIITLAGGPVTIGIIALVGAVAAVYEGITALGEDLTEDLADKIATNHDELACSIYHADGSQDAVVELKAKIDELFTATEALLIKNMNLDASLKALYGGRYNQEDIAENMSNLGLDPADYDCTCPITADYSYTWSFPSANPSDSGKWQTSGGCGFTPASGNPSDGWCALFNSGALWITTANLRATQGLGAGEADIVRVTFDVNCANANVGHPHMIINQDGGSPTEINFPYYQPWITRVHEFDPPLTAGASRRAVFFEPSKTGSAGQMWFDNVTIEFNAT